MEAYLSRLAKGVRPAAPAPQGADRREVDTYLAALRVADEAEHWGDVALALAVCRGVLDGLPDMARYLSLCILFASSGMTPDEGERWLQSARALTWAIDRHGETARYGPRERTEAESEDGNAPF